MNQPQELTEDDFRRMLTNPFYCLPQIHETMTHEHKTMITEEEFIKVAKILIDEIGVEEYMRNLLENLKGNYVTNEDF